MKRTSYMKVLAIIVLLLPLVLGAMYASAANPHIPEPEADCWSVKVDLSHDGEFDVTKNDVTVSYSVTEDLTHVSWTSTAPVSKIFVFGGVSKGDWYNDGLPASEGAFHSELLGPHDQVQQISNVTFYFCPEEEDENGNGDNGDDENGDNGDPDNGNGDNGTPDNGNGDNGNGDPDNGNGDNGDGGGDEENGDLPPTGGSNWYIFGALILIGIGFYLYKRK